jgi:hypothetical protein
MAEVRYHRVSPKFWSDPTVLGWDDDTRLLALYLLTCEHRTTEGLFRLPRQYVLADLEWLPERLSEPFQRLIDDGFIEYDDDARVMLIVKALAYQAPSNPNGVKSALKTVASLPPSRLYSRFYSLAEQYSERLHEALPEPLDEPFDEPLGDPLALALAPAPKTAPAEPTPADDGFDEFWSRYPRGPAGKLGGDGAKKTAQASWKRMTVGQRRLALAAIDNYSAYLNEPGSPNAAHASTWLNQERWEQWQTPAKPKHQASGWR